MTSSIPPVPLLRRLAPYRHLLKTETTERTTNFLVFGQSRSGSTLLRGFLNAHPDVVCEGEPLSSWVPWPERYCEALSRRSPAKVFGFKVFIHHLRDDQRGVDPRRFLESLQQRGYRIFYLRRENLVRHALSNFVREQTGVTHVRGTRPKLDSFEIDVDAFVTHLEIRDRLWREADEIMAGVDHHRIVYERDLMNAGRHQRTADEAFAYLGLTPVPVQAKLRRINEKPLPELIRNYDTLAERLRRASYESWLDGRPAG